MVLSLLSRVATLFHRPKQANCSVLSTSSPRNLGNSTSTSNFPSHSAAIFCSITFFYKCLYRQIDLNVHGFVSFVTHGRTRLSNSFNLKTPICKTSAFQASYFNRIVKFTCKSVPESSFSSIDVFKIFLKQTLTSLLRTTFDVECRCTWSLVRSCACHRS